MAGGVTGSNEQGGGAVEGAARDGAAQGVGVPSSEGNPIANIVVCCDGSWCGDAMNTDTNIKIIARAFADNKLSTPDTLMDAKADNRSFYNEATHTQVGFFAGAGALPNKSLAEHLVQGAMALDIDEKCMEAYKFIVKYFRPGVKIWLFGLSRGAYTVRCVAGMIYNCGVLDLAKIKGHPLFKSDSSDPAKRQEYFDKAYDLMIEEVYRIYRDGSDNCKPSSDYSVEFREKWSHDPRGYGPCIRFMGLLDTVGALGIPMLSPGLMFSYDGMGASTTSDKSGKQLYDQVVSWEVQTVCQALAMTDRFAPFTPCFVKRQVYPANSNNMPRYDKMDGKTYSYETEELWFPGSHYDIGRQNFRVLPNDMGLLADAFNIWNPLNVDFTPELSDPPLKWLLSRARASDLSAPNGRKNVLPHSFDHYMSLSPQPALLALAHDLVFPPWTIDAYDHFIGKIEAWVARYLRRLPHVVLNSIKIVVRSQLLEDRRIPANLPGDGSTGLPIFGVKDQPDTWRFRQAQPHGEPRITKYQSKTFERWFRARVPKLDDRPWDQMSLVPEF